MPTIEVASFIKKPKEDVYAVVKRMEDFPRFMRYVKNLKVIKQNPESIVTLWEIEIDGAKVSWKEENVFDDAAMIMRFHMAEGSYKDYKGQWAIENDPQGSKLSLKVDFDWGIPILEPYVSKALMNRARRGLLGMVKAIKKKAESDV